MSEELRSPCLDCPKKNENKMYYSGGKRSRRQQIDHACSKTCERLSMWQTINSKSPYLGTGIDSMSNDY